jgi:sterol desaturase/sphingolipid hydroxylase (fatty acid hydroxylase superfamily)
MVNMTYLVLGIFMGIFTANFGEYWTHRLLHKFKITVHFNHHKENKSHGWLQEYWLYLYPAIPVVIVTATILWFFLNPLISIGWVIGAVSHIGFSAYLHELCHTKPSLLFWMEQPVHYIHHKYEDSDKSHNFSFSTTLWDKLFRTYRRDTNWKREQFTFKEFFLIKWF